jgi:hypothetical protein
MIGFSKGLTSWLIPPIPPIDGGCGGITVGVTGGKIGGGVTGGNCGGCIGGKGLTNGSGLLNIGLKPVIFIGSPIGAIIDALKSRIILYLSH